MYMYICVKRQYPVINIVQKLFHSLIVGDNLERIGMMPTCNIYRRAITL